MVEVKLPTATGCYEAGILENVIMDSLGKRSLIVQDGRGCRVPGVTYGGCFAGCKSVLKDRKERHQMADFLAP